MVLWLRHKSFPIPSTNISSTPDPFVIEVNCVTMRGVQRRRGLRGRGREACLHGEDDDAIHPVHSTLVCVKL